MEGSLFVIRIWKTIQGEGPYAGHPAVFVRLAGCNAHCSWCDTDYETGRRLMSLQEICEEVDRLAGTAKLVVVTGGEPFLQRGVCDLLDLLACRYQVQMETNGTVHPDGVIPDNVVVVCSPKPGRKIDPDLVSRIDAWKYIIKAGEVTEEGLPKDTQPPPKGATVYVQPMDEHDEQKNRENLQEAIRISQEHGYLLSLQIHKIIGVD